MRKGRGPSGGGGICTRGEGPRWGRGGGSQIYHIGAGEWGRAASELVVEGYYGGIGGSGGAGGESGVSGLGDGAWRRRTET